MKRDRFEGLDPRIKKLVLSKDNSLDLLLEELNNSRKTSSACYVGVIQLIQDMNYLARMPRVKNQVQTTSELKINGETIIIEFTGKSFEFFKKITRNNREQVDPVTFGTLMKEYSMGFQDYEELLRDMLQLEKRNHNKIESLEIQLDEKEKIRKRVHLERDDFEKKLKKLDETSMKIAETLKMDNDPVLVLNELSRRDSRNSMMNRLLLVVCFGTLAILLATNIDTLSAIGNQL